MTVGADGARFTVGVEEEFQIVDAETLELRPRSERIVPEAKSLLGDEVQRELSQSVVETGTPVCSSLADVRSELVRLRGVVAAVAARHGSLIAATGTHPHSEWLGQTITEQDRYLDMAEDYQQLAREQLICGCHVHVAIDDRDIAIRIMDHVRTWLPTLLALAGNSPYWQRIDTGYASYRTQIFERWPTTGIPSRFGSRAAYDDLVGSLVKCGAITDATKLYWDLRPSARFDTLEFRVADVMLTVDDTVLLVALCRSLVRTAYDAALSGEVPADPPPEVLRAARWRAARYGLDDRLVDVHHGTLVPAGAAVDELLRFVRADLEGAGEWDEAIALWRRVAAEGNGARRQRAAFQRSGSWADLMRYVVEQTLPG